MADTNVATGDVETVKRWASKLWIEMPREIDSQGLVAQ